LHRFEISKKVGIVDIPLLVRRNLSLLAKRWDDDLLANELVYKEKALKKYVTKVFAAWAGGEE
jgi:hypothetical protein